TVLIPPSLGPSIAPAGTRTGAARTVDDALPRLAPGRRAAPAFPAAPPASARRGRTSRPGPR
ncbi:hypothetical protein, partial [Streptomyces sp. NPDC002545]